MISGYSIDGGSPSSDLQSVVINFVSAEVCKLIFGSSYHNDSMICAMAANKDACQVFLENKVE